ncbi:MAG: recombination protein RecR [Oscillospiraceae bacterium]|jgi:recombination protein RecR|nr:recombination protein RecR [Oscillospiraceae bacterium]MBQ8010176.1 recombination protein RecR [Oscillospiraceae bacterium]MBQ9111101.1 recombination protein RecR [Oscillospiraceae bacterium]
MASHDALPLVVLTEQFAKLPGIGMKTAARLAYHVMSMEAADVEEFAQALLNAKKTVHYCRCCENLTDQELCSVCEDDTRDRSLICVVETPKDIAAFERTGEYRGTYHVLHGLISPLRGVLPDDLKIRSLLHRVQAGGIQEVIMATNPTVEGDATAAYISQLLKPLNVTVSRLAFGLPVGGMLEYADEVTLYKALENRNII